MRVVASTRVGARTLVRRAALLATVALARASPPAAPPRFPPAPVAARVRAALLGGLAGDALALAGHYEYDARVIAQKHGGSVTDFAAPGSNHGIGWGTANYHPGKRACPRNVYRSLLACADASAIHSASAQLRAT
jgi:hypothetical protein